jgi:hypothetical protein
MPLFAILSVLRRPTNQSFYTTLANESVVSDAGWYEGYDFPFQYTDGSLIGWFRRSGSHTDDGPIMFRRSTDGGSSYTSSQVIVDGNLITGQALTGGLLTSGANAGRQFIGWQDVTGAWVKVAYRDNLTSQFTQCATINAPANTTMHFSTAPIRKMPDGTLRFGVYILPTSGASSIARFINGSADGTTWSLGDTIATHTTQATASPYTDWKFNEWDWICTHDTGVNATSKFISVLRVALPDDGGTYYLLYRSTGGTVWTLDSTEDAGSFTNDIGASVGGPFSRGLVYRFMATNSPPSLAKYNGTIYLAVGNRNTTLGPRQQYTTATPDGAYENIWSNWADTTDVYTFEDTGGSVLELGYGVLYEAKETSGGTPKLLCNPMEMSLQANTGNSDKRTRIVQLIIAST